MVNVMRDKVKLFVTKYSILRNILLYLFFTSVKKKIIGTNNRVNYTGSILKDVTFHIEGNNNTIDIGEGCRLNKVTFSVYGNNHKITIGKNCEFNQDVSIWIEDNNCTLTIGNKSLFRNVHISVTEPNSKVIIGDDCMVARRTEIRTGDSHPVICKETGRCLNFAEDVHIGNHVWIATNSMVLKGAVVSNDCIVAAGSIVTKKFYNSGVILGGVPAKVIKENITWSKENISKTKSLEKLGNQVDISFSLLQNN